MTKKDDLLASSPAAFHETVIISSFLQKGVWILSGEGGMMREMGDGGDGR